MYVVKRSEENPVLVPDQNHYWEEFATFNMCPVKVGSSVYGVYRAISAVDAIRTPHQISTIGIAKSKDGIHWKDRKIFIEPEEEWDQFGCEDPRVTFFEGKYYIFYTALSRYPFGPEGIKVAVAVSRDMKKIDERHFVTPFNAKAMTLFPERVNGKITVIFSAHTDSPPSKMAIAQVNKIEDLWSNKFWEKWEQHIDEHTIDMRRNPYNHVEIGSPPIKTKYGWLMIYSHIQNYFPHPRGFERIFGIEAVLLDLKEPKKIRGRTRGPLIAPEEMYELSGYISDVIFPSGALLEKDTLTIYYGAADTTVCTAKVNFTDLVKSMHPEEGIEYRFKRYDGNPIIAPRDMAWEAKGTFNPAAIMVDKKIHILYRAFSSDNTSTMGYAMTENGTDIVERLHEPVYVAREEFEMKKNSGGFSGCEDPRLTRIGDNIYMCYTAFDTIGPPRVAITSIAVKDFTAKKWNWAKPFIITPNNVDDKDACLFPEKFKHGYFVMHRVSNEICGDYLKTLDFATDSVKKCIRILGARHNMWDSAKVGIASPPIKTKYGWILLYHGVSKSNSTYRIGAILLDLKDPAIVLARSTDPVFEPEMKYEKEDFIPNVVFPCGIIEKEGLLYIYYGGADQVVGVATMKTEVLAQALVHGKKLE